MRRPGIVLPFALIALIVVGVGAFILVDLRGAARETQDLYAGLARGLDLIGGLQYETPEARRGMLYALTTRDGNQSVAYTDESRGVHSGVARVQPLQARQAGFTVLDDP